ncbi:MAG: hypothetical protein U1A78_20315 [Polyangia bacterium]
MLITIAKVLVFVGIMLVAAVPLLPILALVPWHFLALHRGLTKRLPTRCVVSLDDGSFDVIRGSTHTRHALSAIVRGRFVRNDNWTESKMLEDALGLFAARGREVVRLPESTEGLDALLAELHRRGVPIEDVSVSAPAYLD